MTLSQQGLPAIIKLRHESQYIIQHLKPNRAIWHPTSLRAAAIILTLLSHRFSEKPIWCDSLSHGDSNTDSNNCTRLKLPMVHIKYQGGCHGNDALVQGGSAFLHANFLWRATNEKCGDCRQAQARAPAIGGARQLCLRCVCFFSRWLTVKPVFLGDRKGNTLFHKHHIILSPYLRAEEILYTNENRRSAWEWIRSNSNLNWHFKMEEAGLWLRMEAAECICFWFYESRSTFPAAFPLVFKSVIHAPLSPRWHKCASFRPVDEAAD